MQASEGEKGRRDHSAERTSSCGVAKPAVDGRHWMARCLPKLHLSEETAAGRYVVGEGGQLLRTVAKWALEEHMARRRIVR